MLHLCSRSLFRWLPVLFLLHPFFLAAQPIIVAPELRYQSVLPDIRPFFAGKFEPRIGGWRESADRKLRLDIGTSVDLWRNKVEHDKGEKPLLWCIGTDFFTWTRLRSSGGFKFPVEAVDYHFGLFGYLRFPELADIHARVAHVSAHLVDGDTTFFASGGKPITFSREFVDAKIVREESLSSGPFSRMPAELRYYVGGYYLFHTIPDTLGRLSPYAGLDFSWQLWQAKPVTIRFGYQARLNTELEPIGEHSLRAGIKLAEMPNSGVVLEGAYYTGRSPYGQYFSRRENYFSLGFSVEH